LQLRRHLRFNNGFFVEAGANDGLTYSNSLYFEKYHNWTGLLIEPISDLAQKCKQDRPTCLVENCALVPSDFKDAYIDMRYCNLMSLVKGAMKSHEQESEHVRIG